MRLTLIITTLLSIGVLFVAAGYSAPFGANAITDDSDDVGDDDRPFGEQDPQCGDQIGDDEDPGDTAPEDTPPAQVGFSGQQTASPAPSSTWDGDHDIEEDDCFLDPTLAAETDTPAPTATPTPSPTPSFTPFLDLLEGADADCDGGVGGSDAIALLRSLSGAGGDVCSGGDADCNGDVNSADVARILRIMAGLSESC